MQFLLLSNNRKVFCCSDDIKNAATAIIENHASPYYSLKTRILRIYVLIFEKAYEAAEAQYLDALEYAYNREFRQFIYRLNFIYAHLIMWENRLSANGNDFADISLLALKQLVDTKIGSDNSFSIDDLRESKTVLRLITMCKNKYPNYLNEFTDSQKEFIKKIINDNKYAPKMTDSILEFRFNGVQFPNC